MSDYKTKISLKINNFLLPLKISLVKEDNPPPLFLLILLMSTCSLLDWRLTRMVWHESPNSFGWWRCYCSGVIGGGSAMAKRWLRQRMLTWIDKDDNVILLLKGNWSRISWGVYQCPLRLIIAHHLQSPSWLLNQTWHILDWPLCKKLCLGMSFGWESFFQILNQTWERETHLNIPRNIKLSPKPNAT